jgi:hypothetical protein
MEAVQLASLRFGVHHVRVVRIEYAREPVAAADVDPVAVDDPFLRERARRPDPVEVVLESPTDPVRRRHVDVDAVEFASREPVEVVPGLPGVVRLVEAPSVPSSSLSRLAGSITSAWQSGWTFLKASSRNDLPPSSDTCTRNPST